MYGYSKSALSYVYGSVVGNPVGRIFACSPPPGMLFLVSFTCKDTWIESYQTLFLVPGFILAISSTITCYQCVTCVLVP